MSDRLTAKQVEILKAADARGVLLPDADMRSLFKHIESLEAEVERLRAALVEIRDADSNLGPMYDWADEKFQAVKEIAREALEENNS